MRKSFLKNKKLLVFIAIIIIIISVYLVNKDRFVPNTPTCPVGNNSVRISNGLLCYLPTCNSAQRKYVKVRFFKGVKTENGKKIPLLITNTNDTISNSITLFSIFNQLSNDDKTQLVNYITSLINSRSRSVYGNLSSLDPSGSKMVWGFLATTNGVESTTFISLNNTTNQNLRRNFDNANIKDLYIAACVNPTSTTIKLVQPPTTSSLTFLNFNISGPRPTSYATIA